METNLFLKTNIALNFKALCKPCLSFYMFRNCESQPVKVDYDL